MKLFQLTSPKGKGKRKKKKKKNLIFLGQLIKKMIYFFGGVPLFYIMYSHQGMGLGIPERSAPSAPEGALMLGNAPAHHASGVTILIRGFQWIR